MRIYKPRKTKITEANKNSLMHLLKNPELTLADKRSHVVEHNPLFYCLGETLDPRNPYEGELNGQT